MSSVEPANMTERSPSGRWNREVESVLNALAVLKTTLGLPVSCEGSQKLGKWKEGPCSESTTECKESQPGSRDTV